MSKMGKYCKAYPISRLREYQGWAEKNKNNTKEEKIIDGKDVEADGQVAELSHLYLQENYVVTNGIFLDENIIFDDVTPEWIDFCKNSLKFEIPVDNRPSN
ncbi:MAG: hypothetical protein L0226_10950 [Acidobacteria bacterium]|nr:hypothetical protein [Acidobacteriota bacterium]